VIDVAILVVLTLLCINLLFAGAGMAFFSLAAGVAAFFLMLRYGAPAIDRVIGLLPWDKVRAGGRRLVAHVATKVRTRFFYVAVGYGVANWLCGAGNVYLLLRTAGSIPLGIADAFSVMVVSMIGGAIPALPGGFGTYEVAVVFALKGYGY